MDGTITLENILEIWNEKFASHSLTAADLKSPQAMVNALFLVFSSLDIDIEVVLKPPLKEERNENTHYYWDLIPIINLTRVINHIVFTCPVTQVNISHFLQPQTQTSFPILMMMLNFMNFNEQRLAMLQPFEEEIMANNEQIKKLENRKNELIQLQNDNAAEKGNRAQRTQKMEEEIKLLEEMRKPEKEACDAEYIKLDPILQENQKVQRVLDQMLSQLEMLGAGIEKLKAQKVCDADDIKKQEYKLSQEMAEVEDKYNILTAALMQKENSLMNLQTTKQSFNSANDCLQGILDLVDSLKELQSGNFDVDSEEGEIKMLNTELGELQSQDAELMTASKEIGKQRQDATNRRQQEKSSAERLIFELGERDKKQMEQVQKEVQLVEDIKKCLSEYVHLETVLPQQQADIKEDFTKNIQSLDDQIMQELMKYGEKIKQKLYEK